MCPKSTRDEARFPCIDSRAIPRSPFNTTGGSTYFRQLQRCPENTAPSLEEHQLQHSNSRNAPSTPNRLEMRADPLARLKTYANFPEAPQEEASLSNRQLQRCPENTAPSLEEHQLQHSNSRNDPSTPNRLEMRADPLARLKTYANFPEAPQEEASLSNRQLQRCPENTAPSLEEHQLQHSNSRNAPSTPNRLEMRADPLARLKTYANFPEAPQEEASLSNRQLQRCPENTAPSLEEHQLQHSNSRNAPSTPNRLEMRADPLARLKTYANFPEAPQEEASLSNRQLQRCPENTAPSLEEHQLQHSNSRNAPSTPNRLEMRADPLARLKTYANFPEAPQEEASLSNRQLQRCPENTAPSLEEHQLQHSNSRNAPSTPNRLEMRADPLARLKTYANFPEAPQEEASLSNRQLQRCPENTAPSLEEHQLQHSNSRNAPSTPNRLEMRADPLARLKTYANFPEAPQEEASLSNRQLQRCPENTAPSLEEHQLQHSNSRNAPSTPNRLEMRADPLARLKTYANFPEAPQEEASLSNRQLQRCPENTAPSLEEHQLQHSNSRNAPSTPNRLEMRADPLARLKTYANFPEAPQEEASLSNRQLQRCPENTAPSLEEHQLQHSNSRNAPSTPNRLEMRADPLARLKTYANFPEAPQEEASLSNRQLQRCPENTAPSLEEHQLQHSNSRNAPSTPNRLEMRADPLARLKTYANFPEAPQEEASLSNRQLQRCPENTAPSLEEHQLQHSNSRNAPSTPNRLEMRADPLARLKTYANFPEAPQEEASLSNRQLQRCPENTAPSLEEHQLQHSNSRNAPSTPNRLEMRADPLARLKTYANFPEAPQEEASLSNRQLQRCPENTAPSLEEHQLQHSNSRNAPSTPNRLEMRADPLARLKTYANFPEAPQEEASLSNRQLQRCPENTAPSLEEHQLQHSNSRNAPSTPNRLEMRADPLARLKTYANFPEAPQEEASLSN
ncbi:unnamed protein product, partial [Rangifer tarandus platyrhynchus]